MLQRALFAAFGLCGSRYLLLPESESRQIQLWGYGGPVIYGQTRKAWSSRHQHLAFYVSWEVACIREDKARVEIHDWEGPLASGSQYVILRKIGREWFAVRWLSGAIS